MLPRKAGEGRKLSFAILAELHMSPTRKIMFFQRVGHLQVYTPQFAGRDIYVLCIYIVWNRESRIPKVGQIMRVASW